MARPKKTVDDDTQDAFDAQAGEEKGVDDAYEETAHKAGKKGALVKVYNRGNQTFQHKEFGDLGPNQAGEFPQSHADTLKRISDGQVVDEATALKEFREAKLNSPKTGYDQDLTATTGHGGKTGQKTGPR